MVTDTNIPNDDQENNKSNLAENDSDSLKNTPISDDNYQDASSEIDESQDYDEDLFKIPDDIEMFDEIAGIYQIWGNWAYFELTILIPHLSENIPVKIIQPELIPNTADHEFVYPIFDYGNRLSASKGSEMYSVGMSMCKFYYTIEKMIAILIEKIVAGGITDTDMECQVAFDGHQLGQRKAFESIINLNYNVVVSNFDPGEWGEKYLASIKLLAEKDYGYPPEAPRDVYKRHVGSTPGKSST